MSWGEATFCKYVNDLYITSMLGLNVDIPYVRFEKAPDRAGQSSPYAMVIEDALGKPKDGHLDMGFLQRLLKLFNGLFRNRYVKVDLARIAMDQLLPHYQTTTSESAYADLVLRMQSVLAERASNWECPYLLCTIKVLCHNNSIQAAQRLQELWASISTIPKRAIDQIVRELHILALYANACRASIIKKGTDAELGKEGAPTSKVKRKQLSQTRGSRLFSLVLERIRDNVNLVRHSDLGDVSRLALSKEDRSHPPRVVEAIVRLSEALSDPMGMADERVAASRKSLKETFPGLALGFRRAARDPEASKCQSISEVPSNSYYLTVRVRRHKERRWLKPLRVLFPDTSATDARHKTLAIDHLLSALLHGTRFPLHGSDQIDVRTKDVLGAANDVFRHVPAGTNQVLAMSCILSSIGCSEYMAFRLEYIYSDILLCSDHHQRELLKVISQMLRKCARSCTGRAVRPQQVAQLAYLELAFGRSANTTDWDSERKNRCHTYHHIKGPVMPKLSGGTHFELDTVELGRGYTKPDDMYYKELENKIEGIVKLIMNPNHIKTTFRDFYARRHEWVASGSSSGYRLPKDARLGKASGITANKRAWAEAHSVEHMQAYMLDRAPTELATASEKFENGKSRAIYGVCPEHYVINTYVTQGMEERLHKVPGLEKGATGLQELVYIAKRLNVSRDPKQECTMLDFADFNIHHTPRAQNILFEVIAKVGSRLGASKDWVHAATWLARAKLNQVVLFPGQRKALRVTQGMFSGTRSTDLINTILNLAYFQVASDYLASLGLYATDLYHVHQGDDVWLSNSNGLWARMLYYVMSNQGFIFQPSKQMFGKGRGEFLRVLYQSGTAAGYLQRAVVNYILRPIQNSMNIGIAEWANTITETCRVLRRRGMTLFAASALWSDGIHQYTKVKVHPDDDRPVQIPLQYLMTPREFGGLGASPPGICCTSRSTPKLAPVTEDNIPPEFLDALPSKMADDWIAYISPKVHAKYPPEISHTFRGGAMIEAMLRENYGPELLLANQGRIAREYKEAAAKLSGECMRDGTFKEKFLRRVDNIPDLEQTLRKEGPSSRWTISSNKEYIAIAIDYSLRNVGRVRNVTKLRDALARLTASSIFKTESRVAQAFGVSKLRAMELIIAENMNSVKQNRHLTAILGTIIRYGRSDLLDVLQGSGTSIFQSASEWQDARFTNYIASIAAELLVMSCAFDISHGGGNVFTTNWQEYLSMVSLLEKSEYPRSAILY